MEITEAQQRLAELVDAVRNDGVVYVTQRNRQVAKLGVPSRLGRPRVVSIQDMTAIVVDSVETRGTSPTI